MLKKTFNIRLKFSNRTKGFLLLWLLIALPFVYLCVAPSLWPASSLEDVKAQEQEQEPFYILSGDIIKNFKFETFAGSQISQSGGLYDNKLKFESGPYWKVDKDSVEFLYEHRVGNRVYSYYKITMTNRINVYTNIPYSKACQVMYPSTDSYPAVDYKYENILGVRKDRWVSEIKWSHWSFGDVRSYVSQYCSYTGPLVMSFDIAQSTLPAFFKDEAGTTNTKKFDYISVGAIGITDLQYGSLSDYEPEINGIVPNDFKSESPIKSQNLGESGRGSMCKSFSIDLNARLSAPFYNSIDEGLQGQSVGSSCNPLRKNGQPIFDCRTQDASMTDCQFSVNIGRLSPVVKEYYSTFSYTYHKIRAKDDVGHIDSTHDRSNMAYSKQVALHTENRGQQYEIQVDFFVWTSYKMEYKPTNPQNEYPELQQPTEHYDQSTWAHYTSGYHGGDITIENPDLLGSILDMLFGPLEDAIQKFLELIMFVALVAICGIIGLIILLNVLKRRKSGDGGGDTYVEQTFVTPPEYYQNRKDTNPSMQQEAKKYDDTNSN